MTADDLGPFSGLTPMPLDFDASVRIDRVFDQALKALEAHPRRPEAIEGLTGIDERADFPPHRLPELFARAAAVALQQCVHDGVAAIYVFDPAGGRYYQLPWDGLLSPFISTTRMGGQDTSTRAARTSETSWANGTLYEIDCDSALHRLARHRMPLLTTEAEAAALLGSLPVLFDAEAQRDDPPDTSDLDPKSKSAWIETAQQRRLWTVADAMLWIALRDLDAVAAINLTAAWGGASGREGPSGTGGIVWAGAHLDSWKRVVVEPAPVHALSTALELGTVKASGCFGGIDARKPIEAEQWEDLKLAEAPRGVADGSFAQRKDHLFGAAYNGHWTRIRIDRETLFDAFPAVEGTRDEPADTSLRAALEAMKRDGCALAPRTVARYVVALRWPTKKGQARQKLIDTMRHWSPPKWAEISAMAETIGLKPE